MRLGLVVVLAVVACGGEEEASSTTGACQCSVTLGEPVAIELDDAGHVCRFEVPPPPTGCPVDPTGNSGTRCAASTREDCFSNVGPENNCQMSPDGFGFESQSAIVACPAMCERAATDEFQGIFDLNCPYD